MPIEITCSGCGARYRVLEKMAGTTAKCKKCSAAIPVPALPIVEESGLKGGPVLRYEPRRREFEHAIGDGDNIDAIDAHVTQHIGPIAMVFHEIISDLVHIDVHWVKPTHDRPFHTLITSGMSDRPMTTPEGAEAFRHAELVICLPPEWPMDQNKWKDPIHYWPIRTLKFLARFPHEYETWLSYLHTVPNGDPPEPFASSTKLCGAMLVPPIFVDAEFSTLKIDDEKTIFFWVVMPLYEEEMNFKLKQGGEALLDRFDKYDINQVIDVRRRNVCQKGWWPFSS